MMGILNRRQVVASAGLAAAAALGIKPTPARPQGPGASEDLRIDHPGPGEAVANHFVPFGTSAGVRKLQATLVKLDGGASPTTPRVRIVRSFLCNRFFWYLPLIGTDAIPAGTYRLTVQANDGSGLATAVRSFTVSTSRNLARPVAGRDKGSPKGTGFNIRINYPRRDATVPPHFVAYGIDDNTGIPGVSYTLIAAAGASQADFVTITPQGDWYIPFAGVQSPASEFLQVYDTKDSQGAAVTFWVS
jgi:hypothetical protein